MAGMRSHIPAICISGLHIDNSPSTSYGRSTVHRSIFHMEAGQPRLPVSNGGSVTIATPGRIGRARRSLHSRCFVDRITSRKQGEIDGVARYIAVATSFGDVWVIVDTTRLAVEKACETDNALSPLDLMHPDRKVHRSPRASPRWLGQPAGV